MSKTTIGVIGGSGIYGLEGLSQVEEIQVKTPFGAPSDALMAGTLGQARVVFLARHGRGHRIPPHDINYRANVWAMKKLGVEWLISLSAVGSMKEEIKPGDLVIVDQFIDRTHGRASTFFEDGIVAHVSMAEPISKPLADVLAKAAEQVLKETGDKARVHRGGTYLVMNGPQFSSKAESLLHRQWGIDVIGMTNMPEAKLAREAEISYATVALATDYDCWHASEEAVTVDAVVAVVKANAERARKVVAKAVEMIPARRDCAAKNALQFAIISDPAAIAPDVRERLAPLVGHYLGANK
jgi:5'-methylthioadenosine phosphorylase